ncbi:MAG: DUF262 domain-containing protein [bacterium]
MKFKDIPQFPHANYIVNIGWKYLNDWLNSHNENTMKLEMNPPYQRGYVWSQQQKIAYIEYQLKGGFSGKDIFWNCKTWNSLKGNPNVVELVDGQQRVKSVLEFLNNKFPIFDGHYFKDFEDTLFVLNADFVMHVNNLQSDKEIVQWYLGMNTGGSIHTDEDLKPAYDMLKELEK